MMKRLCLFTTFQQIFGYCRRSDTEDRKKLGITDFFFIVQKKLVFVLVFVKFLRNILFSGRTWLLKKLFFWKKRKQVQVFLFFLDNEKKFCNTPTFFVFSKFQTKKYRYGISVIRFKTQSPACQAPLHVPSSFQYPDYQFSNEQGSNKPNKCPSTCPQTTTITSTLTY